MKTKMTVKELIKKLKTLKQDKTTKRIRAKKRVIFKSKEQAKTDTYILLAVAALRAVKYGPWMLANQNAKANRPIMLAHNKRIDNAVGWLQSISGAINNK